MNRNSGSALIIALMLVAIAQILLLSIFQMQRIDIRFTTNIKNHAANIQLLDGGLTWARDQIYRIVLSGINKAQYELPETKIHNRITQTTIYDLQARVNINNIDQENFESYTIYFKNLLPNFSQDELTTFLEKLYLYNDFDRFGLTQEELSNIQNESLEDLIKEDGSNEELFDQLKLLSQAAQDSLNNQAPFFSITELLENNILKPAIFKQIYPYLFAVQEATPLNINTANQLSWFSINPTLTLNKVKTIDNLVKTKGPFTSVGNFLADDTLRNFGLESEKLTVLSEYYLVESTVTDQDYSLKLFALIKAYREDNEIIIETIWKSFGTI